MSPPADGRGVPGGFDAADAPTGPLNRGQAPERPPVLAEADVLAGRFRVLRLLGRGGMGEVYEAEDLELRDHIALKLVPPELARDERSLERFRHEVYLARRVTHPNACRLFDVSHHRREGGSDLTFVTMELLRGETLRQRLRRCGPFGVDALRPIARQVASALGAAHAAGIVHQDLKSANVMLVDGPGGEARAVVTDFGLARGHGRGEGGDAGGRGGELVGTPAYMAPEQLSGGTISAATDVFAFGVVLYEMLTGTLPFGPDRPPADRLNERPEPPDRRVPGLDPSWSAAIARCLDPDPGARFASVADLERALGLESEGPSRLRRELDRARRRQNLLALLAAILALGFGLWLLRPTPPPPPTFARTVQLTTAAGLDVFPAPSADGALLAYSAIVGDGFEIQLLPLDATGRARPLTSDGGDNVEAAWSPDGSQIAYHSLRRSGIWVLPVAGGEPRRLVDFGSRPTWSPDGRRVAFQSDGLSPLAANAVPARPPSTLWIVSADGGTPVQVTRPGKPVGGHGTPSWSPDGTHLVFAAYERSSSSLWRVASSGGMPTPLLDDGKLLFDPVVSRDGMRLLYVARSAEGELSLFGAALDAHGQPRHAPASIAALGLGTPRHLALSADGDTAYFSVLGLESNLWWLPLDRDARAAGSPVALTRETGRNSRPAFSADGARLAFEKWSSGERPDVWLLDLDSREARALTRGPDMDAEPAFTADGSVAFLSDRGGGLALWSVDPRSGGTRRNCPLPPEAEFVRVSPDGRDVAFNSTAGSGTTNLWVMPVCDTARPLTRDPELLGFAGWSPDGSELAAQQRRGDSSRVVVVSHHSGAVAPLTEGEQDWAYSFSPDGRRIAFARLRDGVWDLWWVDRDGTQAQLTDRDSRHGYVRYPAWSPRGDGVVYELAESRGNVWRLDLGQER